LSDSVFEGLPEPVANDLTVTARKRFSRTGLAFFVLSGLTLLLQLAAQLLISFAAPEFTQSQWYTWALTSLPMYIVSAPLCWLILKKLDAEPVARSAMGAKWFFTCVIICFGIMYALNLVGVGINSLIGALLGKENANPLQSVVGDSGIWPTFVFAVILAPIFEELFFRRLIIGRVIRYGERFAIIFSALFFALMHGNLYQFFYAFGLGIFFGYIYVSTGRLRYCVAMHMIVNFVGSFISTLLLRVTDIEQLPELSDASSMLSPEAASDFLLRNFDSLIGAAAMGVYALALIGLSIAGVALLIINRKRFVTKPGRLPLPPGRVFSTAYLNPGVLLFVLLCAALMAATVFAA